MRASLHKRCKCRVDFFLVGGIHDLKFNPELLCGFLRFSRVQLRIGIGRIHKQPNLDSVGHRFMTNILNFVQFLSKIPQWLTGQSRRSQTEYPHHGGVALHPQLRCAGNPAATVAGQRAATTVTA
jgi:hypothetical protein